MKALPIGAALAALSLGVAVAQTTPSSQSSTTQPGMTQPSGSTAAPTAAPPATAPTAGTGTGTATGTSAGMTGGNANGGGTAAASGNNNQAVATTSANAPQPAHGHNSFTMGQARTRLRRHGFQNVNGLKLDNAGVWRGTAQQNGQPVNVWLDYKGNVGSGQQ